MFAAEGLASSGGIPYPHRGLVFLLRAARLHFYPVTNAATRVDAAMSHHAVLILSSDPLPAALLGAAVELAGHTPHFARAGESPRAALLRLRPNVVFVDCDHVEACADSFLGPAIMTGARVILIRSPRSARDLDTLSGHGQLTVLGLPFAEGELARLLEEE
jgi:hypothetical protein